MKIQVTRKDTDDYEDPCEIFVDGVLIARAYYFNGPPYVSVTLIKHPDFEIKVTRKDTGDYKDPCEIFVDGIIIARVYYVNGPPFVRVSYKRTVTLKGKTMKVKQQVQRTEIAKHSFQLTAEQFKKIVLSGFFAHRITVPDDAEINIDIPHDEFEIGHINGVNVQWEIEIREQDDNMLGVEDINF